MNIEDLNLRGIYDMLDFKISIMKSNYEDKENPDTEYRSKILDLSALHNYIDSIIDNSDNAFVSNTVNQKIISIINSQLENKNAAILNNKPTNEIHFLFYELNRLKKVLLSA